MASNNQQKPKHAVSKRVRRRRLTVAAIAVVLVLFAIAGGLYGYVRYRYDQVKRVNVNGLNAYTSAQPENILLVGDNSRCTLTKYQSFYQKQHSQFGTCSEVGGGRSDVTLILHVDPATHRAFLLSIPRDLWLPMPGGNGLELRVDDSLNSAERPYLHLPFGPTLLVKTIEQDLGIPINHYVELNFYTFEKVVNTLGGVTMYFPTKLIDHYSGLNITQPGCQHLNGTQALALVRARHLYYYNPKTGTWQYDGTGDLGRIQRTHIFLRLLASQVKKSALSSPIAANSLIGSILPSLKVDQSFTLSQMVNLALAFRHVDPASIPSATLPVIIPGSTSFVDTANPSNYQAPGEIVMPYQPNDLSIISQFLGSSAPKYQSVSPSSVTITVHNASGTSGIGSQAAAQLKLLGFDATDGGHSTYAGTDSETVVWYKPGHMIQAEKVLSDISGQAIMGEGSPNQASDIVVTAGSTFAIASPPSSSSGTSTSTNNSPSSSTNQAAAPAPTTGGADSATQVAQLASTNLWGANHPAPWWDPRACPTK